MVDKPKTDKDIARKIWLAGIGAYGRAFDDAQQAYAKVGKETAKLFEELVDRGEELEEQVSEAAKTTLPEIAEKHRATVEDRMERMKAALGFGETVREQQDRIEALETRLVSIEEKLDKLLDSVKALKPASNRPGKTEKKT